MNRRTRFAVATTMASLLALGGGSLVQAADTPEGAVTAVLDAFVAKDFQGIAPLVCEARRDEISRQLDPAAALGDQGFDPQVILDAITITMADPQVTLADFSQDGMTATVHLATTMTMKIELSEDQLRDLVASALEAQGMEVTDQLIDQFLPMMVQMLNQTQTQDVDVDVTVVNENGQWLMCDTFEEAEPSALPSEGPLPSMLPIESPAM